jgi:hypothetical protein
MRSALATLCPFLFSRRYPAKSHYRTRIVSRVQVRPRIHSGIPLRGASLGQVQQGKPVCKEQSHHLISCVGAI